MVSSRHFSQTMRSSISLVTTITISQKPMCPHQIPLSKKIPLLMTTLTRCGSPQPVLCWNAVMPSLWLRCLPFMVWVIQTPTCRCCCILCRAIGSAVMTLFVVWSKCNTPVTNWSFCVVPTVFAVKLLIFSQLNQIRMRFGWNCSTMRWIQSAGLIR